MLFRTIAGAKSKPYVASLTAACAMVAMLLSGCASKEQRAAMETQFDKTHRQPVVAEINEVSKYVTAQHLAACKAHIEAAETLFGLK
jgi:type IV pilus biogenesis protein CpaD/CtpE